MSDAIGHLIPKRNPETQERHRRQMFWQVYFPLGVGVGLMLVVCSLPVIVIAQGGEVQKWADISLMWTIIPAMLFSLLPLGLLVGSIFGLVKLLQQLPGWMFRVQEVSNQVRFLVRQYSDKAVEPVIQAQSFNARIRAALPKRNQK